MQPSKETNTILWCSPLGQHSISCASSGLNPSSTHPAMICLLVMFLSSFPLKIPTQSHQHYHNVEAMTSGYCFCLIFRYGRQVPYYKGVLTSHPRFTFVTVTTILLPLQLQSPLPVGASTQVPLWNFPHWGPTSPVLLTTPLLPRTPSHTGNRC